jgi:hypothetical protein
MISLPHWFPELDIHAAFRPFFDVWLESMNRRYECRWFIITRVNIRLLCWRGSWRIDTGFAIYKREER